MCTSVDARYHCTQKLCLTRRYNGIQYMYALYVIVYLITWHLISLRGWIVIIEHYLEYLQEYILE